jgi:hypothetical protein
VRPEDIDFAYADVPDDELANAHAALRRDVEHHARSLGGTVVWPEAFLVGEELTAEVVCLAGVTPQRVDWLWPGHLPAAKLVMLDGDPDVGKSVVSLDIGARLTTGSPLPDGYQPDEPTGVLILTAEDDYRDTVVPRLLAASADLDRCFALPSVPAVGDNGKLTQRPPVLPTDVGHLEKAITDHNVGLVVIDVLVAYLPAKTDSHRDQDVRQALAPLVLVAQRTGACILALRHLNKTPGTPAIYRGGGSIGIIGSVRAGWLAGYDPEDPKRRVLAIQKSNLAAKAPSLVYRIVEDDLYGCARVVWEGATDRMADDLVLNPPNPEERTAVAEAVAFLTDLLGDGPVLATKVLSGARSACISERTLRRAKDKLRVDSRKLGQPGDKDQSWVWVLPGCESSDAEMAKVSNTNSRPSSEPLAIFDSKAASTPEDVHESVLDTLAASGGPSRDVDVLDELIKRRGPGRRMPGGRILGASDYVELPDGFTPIPEGARDICRGCGLPCDTADAVGPRHPDCEPF